MPVNLPCVRLSLLAVALVATPVFAQSAANAPATRQQGSVPLGSALSTFAAEHGAALSFDPAMTRGRLAPVVAKDLALDAGFAALLQGSRLRAVRRADGSYTLERQAGARRWVHGGCPSRWGG